MSQIIAILNFEEGCREAPYLDTQGFPTVAGGIRTVRAINNHNDLWDQHCRPSAH